MPLIELVLPDFIIENYTLTHVDKSEERYHVHLEEKNYPEGDPRKADLLSKGYFPTITLQDFPIRGHKVFLHIKRRRWLNRAANRTKTGKVVHRDWTEVAEGTRMTSEFSAFLSDRRSERNWWIRGLMTFGVLVAFMESMVRIYCANTVIFRVDLKIGASEDMLKNGCCFLKT